MQLIVRGFLASGGIEIYKWQWGLERFSRSDLELNKVVWLVWSCFTCLFEGNDSLWNY